MTTEFCSSCGENAVQERVVPLAFEHNGQHLEISDRHMFCERCGNISYIGKQISEHEFAIAAAIRATEGLLSAEELRRVRSKYRLKQTDMEQMLSTGPKTWTRWERGKVPQSKAADKLIRLIAEDPDVARSLMEQAKIVNPKACAAVARIEADAWVMFQELYGPSGRRPNDTNAAIASGPGAETFEKLRSVRRAAAARAEAA